MKSHEIEQLVTRFDDMSEEELNYIKGALEAIIIIKNKKDRE